MCVPGVVAQSASRRAVGGAHFHGRLFVGQRCVATCWLGCGSRRRCGEPQGGSVWGGTERHFARAVRSRWRILFSRHGGAHHLGPAHAAHRLRRYHRDNQRSKSTKPWEPKAPAHTSGTGSLFPTTRSGQSRSRVMRQSAVWRRGRTSHLCRRRNDLADTFAKKRAATHTSLLFALPRQSLLVLPWPSKRHDGRPRRTCWSGSGVERHQGCCATLTVRAPRARLKRKRRKETAAPTSVCDWLSLVVPTRLSQDSHLDPRTFRGHSLQMGRVFDSGGRAMDNAIVFCAKCGAVYWERADALCRRCREFPGGRASQLRKLRSGLFPNKRFPGWTVEHVRRPTLDEAATLVAQLESCEAGLGRKVMGPTTPKKQRVAPKAAVLAHWGSVGETIDHKNLALQRFDMGRSGCGRRMGSTISWSQTSLQDFGVMCAVGCDGSSSSKSFGMRCWRHWCSRFLRRKKWAWWQCRATLHATRYARSSTTGKQPSAADL